MQGQHTPPDPIFITGKHTRTRSTRSRWNYLEKGNLFSKVSVSTDYIYWLIKISKIKLELFELELAFIAYSTFTHTNISIYGSIRGCVSQDQNDKCPKSQFRIQPYFTITLIGNDPTTTKKAKIGNSQYWVSHNRLIIQVVRRNISWFTNKISKKCFPSERREKWAVICNGQPCRILIFEIVGAWLFYVLFLGCRQTKLFSWQVVEKRLVTWCVPDRTN